MHHMLHPEHDEPNLLKILKDNGYFVWWGGKNDLTPGQDPIHQYCNERFHPCDQDYARWGLTPREGTHGGDLSWRGDPAGRHGGVSCDLARVRSASARSVARGAAVRLFSGAAVVLRSLPHA